MKEIIIGSNEASKRLDSFLKSYLKDAGSGFIYKMLRKKNITLNDKKADGTEKLCEGDSIKIYFKDETLEKFRGALNSSTQKKSGTQKPADAFPVIYEDSDILLVNKPMGMLSQKASPDDYSLNEWLIDYLLETKEISEESLETFRPSICNRLDRNTTGLVICGKTLSGLRKMNELIKDRKVRKFYRTVVQGRIDEKMSINGYLYKDEKTNRVTIEKKDPGDERYSFIETAYEPLEYLKRDDLTLLEVELITGKPHQIRAHLSSMGHPIVGDIKYGGRKIKGLKCQLLHSYRLIFPKDMEEPFERLSEKEFFAPLPKEFELFK